VLRVIRGDATPEEIAALLAVVAARARAVPEPPPRVTASWTDRALTLRAPASPGPGAWRASAWPR
jgi:acyl-CoA carboxylase epsilon subunit